MLKSTTCVEKFNMTDASEMLPCHDDCIEIPSVSQIKGMMRTLSEILYTAWKSEIANRLLHLEFAGIITRDNIGVPSTVWRLPNAEVRYALCKLEQDLQNLGYDYDFKFDEVNELNWTMYYSIMLPDAVCDETTRMEDETTNDATRNEEESTDNDDDNIRISGYDYHAISESDNHSDTSSSASSN
jgi:hypothetical protein